MTDYDTRPASIVDIPLVRRLTEDGVVLDTRIACTTGEHPASALISSMLPTSARHTLMARFGGQQVVAQFYILPNGTSARIAYLAPRLEPGRDDSAWLLALDGITREAGRRRAHNLSAEVDENSPLFVTLRQAGFSVYARQELWIHHPGGTGSLSSSLNVTPVTEDDLLEMQLLYARLVPNLLQQAGIGAEESGYVCRQHGSLVGFVNVAEGREGIFLVPCIDPAAASLADALMAAVIQRLRHAGKRSITVRLRRHDSWLSGTLERNGFVPLASQALMIRHIAAGIRSPQFSTAQQRAAAVAKMPLRGVERVPEVCAKGGHSL